VKIASAVSWTFASVGVKYALKLLGNLTLARLLQPEAFGLAAIVYAVISGVEAMTDAGTRPSIIRSTRTDDLWLDTAWTFQIIRSAFVAVIIASLAFPMGIFFDDSRLVPMIAATGLMSLLVGLTSLEAILSVRSLNLKTFSIVEVIAAVLGYLVMIVWAWVSPTAWALLWGGIVTTGVFTVLSYYVIGRRKHKFRMDRSLVSELVRFGKWVSISSALGFMILQGDRLIIGKLFSIEALGIYFIAVTWAGALQQLVGMFLSRLYLPMVAEFRRKSGDFNAEGRELRALILTSLVVPFAFAAGASDLIIKVLYPDNYSSAGAVMQILVIGAWLSILESMYTDQLLAAGQPRVRVFAQITSIVVLMAALTWVPREYGLTGIAVAFVISTAIRALFMAVVFNRNHYTYAVPDLLWTSAFCVLAIGVHFLVAWLSASNSSFMALFLAFVAFFPIGATLLGVSLRKAIRLSPPKVEALIVQDNELI
jgi:O-antigen/teichoic acid export membrane protein